MLIGATGSIDGQETREPGAPGLRGPGGLTLDQYTPRLQAPTPTTQHTQTLPSPSSSAPAASGHGRPVGTVYRLGNGQLVYVQKAAMSRLLLPQLRLALAL